MRPMSPRKPQSVESDLQRRAQILKAAAEVFAEKGFHKATSKEIARVAGISEGTIYNYFAQKRDLLIGLLHQTSGMDVLGEIQTHPDHDAKTYYAEDARARLHLLRESRHIWRAVLPEVLVDTELRGIFLDAVKQQYTPYVEAYLKARIEQGELAPLDNIPLMVEVMLTIPLGLMTLMMLDDPVLEAQWENLPDAMAHLVYDGLKRKQG